MSSLYKTIAQNIVDYIASMPSTNAKLPTEREFSQMFNVSRQTVRHALDLCEKNDLITRRQGSGIYLSKSYLKSQNHIALITGNSDEYLAPTLINELSTRFNACSYSFDIYETYESLAKQRQIILDLLISPVKVVLVYLTNTALPVPFPDLYNQLVKIGTKIIFIGKPYTNLDNVSYVECDNYMSAYSIAGRIVADNKPWCAIFSYGSLDSIDKYYGFLQFFHEMNIQCDDSNIKWLKYDDIIDMRNKRDTSALSKILLSYEKTPSNYVCFNDELSYWLISELKKQHKLTEEIGIYSFDNSYIKTIAEHPIHSYGSDINALVTAIVEISLNAKKMKEVITLPSSLQL